MRDIAYNNGTVHGTIYKWYVAHKHHNIKEINSFIMRNEKYPSTTIITKDDFDKENCQTILNELADNDYFSIYCVLSKAAQKFLEEDNPKQSKIYWLLSDACSMMLNPNNKNDPFKPFAVSPDGRSAIVDDFSDDEIAFFSDILPNITNIRLKARLSDIIWVKASKKELKYALAAIDSYRQMPLNTKIWGCDGCECWYRAISLTGMLRGGAGDRMQELEKDILQAFDNSTESDGCFAVWLADLMDNFCLGKSRAERIATHLESLARKFDDSEDLCCARNYFNAASKWYGVIKNNTKSIEMTVCYAEAFTKEAKQKNNLCALGHLEKAIQILRTIPRAERSSLQIDERIEQWHKLLTESGQLALNEMGAIKTNAVDISQMIEAAKSAVSELPPIEALKAFANLYPGMHISEMNKSAITELKKYPLSAFIGGTYISQDGRVIAKTSGIDFNSNLDENHPNVQACVMQSHGILISLITQSSILPALEILHLEHRIREIDFLSIAKQSLIVPPGREVLFAKGLYSGYSHDYITAIHLLAPQIENLVRFHLKNAGVKTSTLDLCGIENENGLSTLIALPEMTTVFSEDLTFEIKALFCDPLGANLRNEIAHGLMDHDACNSLHSVYAWWLTLKLVFNTYWNAARQIQKSVVESEGS